MSQDTVRTTIGRTYAVLVTQAPCTLYYQDHDAAEKLTVLTAEEPGTYAFVAFGLLLKKETGSCRIVESFNPAPLGSPAKGGAGVFDSLTVKNESSFNGKMHSAGGLDFGSMISFQDDEGYGGIHISNIRANNSESRIGFESVRLQIQEPVYDWEPTTKNHVEQKTKKLSDDLSTHKQDTICHITTEERTTWNNKADASALSSKVNTATFNAHTGNATAHVTAEERTKWDGKANTNEIPHLNKNNTFSGENVFKTISCNRLNAEEILLAGQQMPVFVEITQTEYQALVEAGTVNPNWIYEIVEDIPEP